jgi:hypothetical protein
MKQQEKGLKIRWGKPRAGSIPAARTNKFRAFLKCDGRVHPVSRSLASCGVGASLFSAGDSTSSLKAALEEVQMSKGPSPRVDQLRAMREAKFARNQQRQREEEKSAAAEPAAPAPEKRASATPAKQAPKKAKSKAKKKSSR